jgi:hypothetical protein
MIATGWVIASLACRVIGLPCVAVVVFAELAVPFFVASLALADQIVFLLRLLACLAELRSDAVFVASPLFALADRVA